MSLRSVHLKQNLNYSFTELVLALLHSHTFTLWPILQFFKTSWCWNVIKLLESVFTSYKLTIFFLIQQAELAKFTSKHFPELPIAHPELGISEFLVRISNVCRFHCTPFS